MSELEPLILTFDPQTVDHLGAKMYSHLPNALAELVANSYDADAKHVRVVVEGNGSISITDDGHGMSREDVREKYLHIGRNRRTDESGLTESGRRQVSGKKGLGKLALFGIGKRVELKTTRAGSSARTQIVLDYDEMKQSTGPYRPTETQASILEGRHGTVVRLSQLKRSSAVSAASVARSLARLFNYVDEEFEVTIVGPEGTEYRVTPESRLDAIEVEFSWTFPDDGGVDNPDLRDLGVGGRVVSTPKPVPQSIRGIALYVNGRLANEADYFDSSASSYAYSYLSGYLNVDYLDRLEPDVIATDRRALDWGRDETIDLRVKLTDFVTWIAGDWRRRRREASAVRATEVLGGSTEEWVSSIKTEEGAVVRELVEAIASEEVEISAEQQGALLSLMKRAVPPHAEYTWRHLHPSIQDATRDRYLIDDFYGAVQEGIKRYVNAARDKSGVPHDEATKIVVNAFGESGRLHVFQRFTESFSEATAKNVEEGQKHVSMGIVAGFRNPMAHEEVLRLHESGAFTFDDCLDALSIVSHLMRRLDEAELIVE
ncbi:MAG: hypothetical protein JWR04_2598 [Rhodoglobus sp.]|nr:hypothetical protein [Rhodoglobus sp.]